MGVRDIALAAHYEREKKYKLEREAREKIANQDAALKRQEQETRGRNTFGFRKLQEWFPGVEWEFIEELRQLTQDYPVHIWKADVYTFMTGPDIPKTDSAIGENEIDSWTTSIRLVTGENSTQRARNVPDKYQVRFLDSVADFGSYIADLDRQESAYYATHTD